MSLHEAYPGHHLQLQRANRLASEVRKLFGTSVFVEGWALYCEEMMYRDRLLSRRADAIDAVGAAIVARLSGGD